MVSERLRSRVLIPLSDASPGRVVLLGYWCHGIVELGERVGSGDE